MDYTLPRLRTKFGECAFSHAGPSTWNALPDHIPAVADPAKFWKHFKLENIGSRIDTQTQASNGRR